MDRLRALYMARSSRRRGDLMPTYTPNLNLEKPMPAIDNVRVSVINDNMDKLDAAVAERLRISDKATQSDAENGTDDVKYMTSLATKQAVIKFAPQLEYKDVTNLSATTAGVIAWGLPLATDQTRTAIMLCRANKDISNMDYATCLADSSVTKTNLGKDIVTNAYSGLAVGTQYWTKAFIQYAVGGENFYSNGVTVTFTTPAQTTFPYYTNGGENVSWSIQAEPPTTVVKLSNSAKLEAPAAPNNEEARFFTTNPIDLTNIKTLKFECTPTGDATRRNVYITNTAGGKLSTAIVSLSITTSDNIKRVYSLDVTSVTGTKHLSAEVMSYVVFGSLSILEVHRVWGES